MGALAGKLQAEAATMIVPMLNRKRTERKVFTIRFLEAAFERKRPINQDESEDHLVPISTLVHLCDFALDLRRPAAPEMDPET